MMMVKSNTFLFIRNLIKRLNLHKHSKTDVKYKRFSLNTVTHSYRTIVLEVNYGLEKRKVKNVNSTNLKVNHSRKNEIDPEMAISKS